MDGVFPKTSPNRESSDTGNVLAQASDTHIPRRAQRSHHVVFGKRACGLGPRLFRSISYVCRTCFMKERLPIGNTVQPQGEIKYSKSLSLGDDFASRVYTSKHVVGNSPPQT